MIFEQDEVTKNDGKPYVVYTPYSRKWMEKFSKENVKDYKSEDLLNSLKKEKCLSCSVIGTIVKKESSHLIKIK